VFAGDNEPVGEVQVSDACGLAYGYLASFVSLDCVIAAEIGQSLTDGIGDHYIRTCIEEVDDGLDLVEGIFRNVESE